MIYLAMFDKDDFIVYWITSLLLIFVKATFFWLLWNWLVTALFNLPELSFWQSVGGWYLYTVITLKYDNKR